MLQAIPAAEVALSGKALEVRGTRRRPAARPAGGDRPRARGRGRPRPRPPQRARAGGGRRADGPGGDARPGRGRGAAARHRAGGLGRGDLSPALGRVRSSCPDRPCPRQPTRQDVTHTLIVSPSPAGWPRLAASTRSRRNRDRAASLRAFRPRRDGTRSGPRGRSRPVRAARPPPGPSGHAAGRHLVQPLLGQAEGLRPRQPDLGLDLARAEGQRAAEAGARPSARTGVAWPRRRTGGAPLSRVGDAEGRHGAQVARSGGGRALAPGRLRRAAPGRRALRRGRARALRPRRERRARGPLPPPRAGRRDGAPRRPGGRPLARQRLQPGGGRRARRRPAPRTRGQARALRALDPDGRERRVPLRPAPALPLRRARQVPRRPVGRRAPGRLRRGRGRGGGREGREPGPGLAAGGAVPGRHPPAAGPAPGLAGPPRSPRPGRAPPSRSGTASPVFPSRRRSAHPSPTLPGRSGTASPIRARPTLRDPVQRLRCRG